MHSNAESLDTSGTILCWLVQEPNEILLCHQIKFNGKLFAKAIRLWGLICAQIGLRISSNNLL